ncbi:MAG: hypothetical protein D6828_02875, partial [Nitrospirae bacterium]
MIQSMTGYGAYESELFKFECRSLNHRFLDIYIKGPVFLYHLEPEIKNIVKGEFTRGKIEVIVSRKKEGAGNVEVNHTLAAELYKAMKTLKEELSLSGSITLELFTPFKELFFIEEPEVGDEVIIDGIRAALRELKEMRLEEGAVIERDIRERIKEMVKLTKEIEKRSEKQVSYIRDRYKERISELLSDIA